MSQTWHAPSRARRADRRGAINKCTPSAPVKRGTEAPPPGSAPPPPPRFFDPSPFNFYFVALKRISSRSVRGGVPLERNLLAFNRHIGMQHVPAILAGHV